MESMKHKITIAILILCLIIAAMFVWYLVTGVPDGGEISGTLVEGTLRAEVVQL